MKKLKTYCEVEGHKPIDWGKFLRKRKYTIDEVSGACIDAQNWVTCAVGNKCSIIPRDGFGCPRDRELQNLGTEFLHHIRLMIASQRSKKFKNARNEAKRVLGEIEKVSARLIRQQKKWDKFRRMDLLKK